jgi:hypothetical protein
MSRPSDELRDIACRVNQQWMPANPYRIHVVADLLDEAEKALTDLLDRAQFIGEPDHDADAWADADSNARTTLARIRGEQP